MFEYLNVLVKIRLILNVLSFPKQYSMVHRCHMLTCSRFISEWSWFDMGVNCCVTCAAYSLSSTTPGGVSFCNLFVNFTVKSKFIWRKMLRMSWGIDKYFFSQKNTFSALSDKAITIPLYTQLHKLVGRSETSYVSQHKIFAVIFSPQPLRAPGYCRRPSGRAAGQQGRQAPLTSIIFHGSFSNLEVLPH